MKISQVIVPPDYTFIYGLPEGGDFGPKSHNSSRGKSGLPEIPSVQHSHTARMEGRHRSTYDRAHLEIGVDLYRIEYAFADSQRGWHIGSIDRPLEPLNLFGHGMGG